MRRLAFGLLAFGPLLFPWYPCLAEQSPEPEKAKIEAAARDYIDGWYEGNAERMARALHPDLAKRVVAALPNGAVIVESLSADNMVEFTRTGGGKGKATPVKQTQVIVLDVSGGIAAVKTISPEFVDYLHLARINGDWRIINVLWEPVKQMPPVK